MNLTAHVTKIVRPDVLVLTGLVPANLLTACTKSTKMWVFLMNLSVILQKYSDFFKCKDEAASKHEKCNKLCNPSDSLCQNVCTLQFSNDLSNCPCGTGCPLGCPCDFYDCDGKWPPHTTPQPTTSGITQTTRADPSKVGQDFETSLFMFRLFRFWWRTVTPTRNPSHFHGNNTKDSL